MNYVLVRYKVLWRFKKHHHLKVTECKNIINCKTNKILKYTTRGFFIVGKYYKRNELNNLIELIPKKQYIPF